MKNFPVLFNGFVFAIHNQDLVFMLLLDRFHSRSSPSRCKQHCFVNKRCAMYRKRDATKCLNNNDFAVNEFKRQNMEEMESVENQ